MTPQSRPPRSPRSASKIRPVAYSTSWLHCSARTARFEFAFDVQTGESSGTVRAAFDAIAFGDYDSAFRSTHYLDHARRAVDYLLSLQALGIVYARFIGNDDLASPDVRYLNHA